MSVSTVVGEILTHVRERQKGRVLQKKPGEYQRRNAWKLPRLGFTLAGAPVGVVLAVLDLIGILHHAVLRIKIAGPSIAFAIFEHQAGDDAVEQVEDTGGIPVDEGSGHTDKQLRDSKQLRHGVALAAVIVVLMQLIAKEAAYAPAQLFLDIGAQGITPLRPANWESSFRVLHDLGELVYYALAFGSLEVCRSSVAVYPAVLSNLDPLNPPAGIDSRPQDCAAVGAAVVFLVLRLEKELVGRHGVAAAVLADLHGHDFIAVGTEEGSPAPVPFHGRIAHIAVPGAFFGKDRIAL